MNILNSYIDAITKFFFSMQYRLFWGYLVFNFILAYFLFFRKLQLSELKLKIMHFFSKKVLFHPSSLLDIKIYFFNNLLRAYITPIAFWWVVYLSDGVRDGYILFIGVSKRIPLSPLWSYSIYSLLLFVVYDFLRFVQHYFQHRFDFYWKIHIIHHSAELLTPLTSHRIHPIDVLLGAFIRIISKIFVLQLLNHFFFVRLSIFNLIGIDFITMTMFALGANLRHSPIPISFGRWEKIFVSPRMHQLHHSLERDSSRVNLGLFLTIWDKLIGTWVIPHEKEMEFVRYGINGLPKNYCRSFFDAIIYPFRNSRTNNKK